MIKHNTVKCIVIIAINKQIFCYYNCFVSTSKSNLDFKKYNKLAKFKKFKSMKKSITVAAVLLSTFTAMAQKEPIIGKWSEVKYSFIDTTDAGRDIIIADYNAYRSGKKVLESKYIEVQNGYTDKNVIAPLLISKVKDELWATDKFNTSHKITFNAKRNKYFITMNGTELEIKHNLKTKNLYFVNPKSNINFYEFKR